MKTQTAAKRASIAAAGGVTLTLAHGLKAAVEGSIPLDHGSAWSLIQDLYAEKVTDFSERDIDTLVQTYSLGAVHHRR